MRMNKPEKQDAGKPCGKYWGLGHDIECKHGILIDADEYHEGFAPDVIRQPCSCNPKFCKSCNGTGEKTYADGVGDCPDCECGWVGGYEMLADLVPEITSED